MATPRRTAGGVVIGPEKKIAVVNQHGYSWSLPKGGVDEDESDLEAAKREIYEETGIDGLELICDLGSYTRARIGKKGVGESPAEKKELFFFLFRTSQAELHPQDPDNPEARWLDIDAVPEILTHPKDKDFFVSVTSTIKTHLE